MTPPDADPADRADFLRDLAGYGLLPPDGWTLFANDRLGTTLPGRPDVQAAASAADEFAAGFWALSPDERRRRWAGLSARSADGPTAAFLAHLERGLNTVAAPHPDPAADELAGIARELLVLRLRQRAVRRAAWLAEKAGGTFRWAETARALAAADPTLASFDPRLFDILTLPGYVTVSAPANRPPELTAAEEAESIRRATADYHRRVAAHHAEQIQGSAPESAKRVAGSVLATVAVIVVGLKALVILAQSAGPATRPDQTPPVRFRQSERPPVTPRLTPNGIDAVWKPVPPAAGPSADDLRTMRLLHRLKNLPPTRR